MASPRVSFQRSGVALEVADVSEPVGALAGFHVGKELLEDFAGVAYQSGVHFDVLVDLGAIDFDVNLAGIAGVGLQVAGDAVIEAHADGDQQIGFLNGVIDPSFAVHAHHAEIQRIAGREAADAEQRHGDREMAGANELLEGLHCA